VAEGIPTRHLSGTRRDGYFGRIEMEYVGGKCNQLCFGKLLVRIRLTPGGKPLLQFRNDWLAGLTPRNRLDNLNLSRYFYRLQD